MASAGSPGAAPPGDAAPLLPGSAASAGGAGPPASRAPRAAAAGDTAAALAGAGGAAGAPRAGGGGGWRLAAGGALAVAAALCVLRAAPRGAAAPRGRGAARGPRGGARPIGAGPRQLDDQLDPAEVFLPASRNGDGGVEALTFEPVDSVAGEFNLSSEDPDSCASYGCGGYGPTRACQCDPTCGKKHTCCYDYSLVCLSTTTLTTTRPPAFFLKDGDKAHGAPAPPHGGRSRGQGSRAASCAVYGCGDFDPSQDCQCNPDCEEHHSCCPDFHEHCAHGHGHSHDQSPPAHGRQAPARSGGHAGGAGQGPRGHHAGGAREAPPGIENPDANCRAFGCLQFFVPELSCQCAPSCRDHGNCCWDYPDACA